MGTTVIEQQLNKEKKGKKNFTGIDYCQKYYSHKRETSSMELEGVCVREWSKGPEFYLI